jgi:putative transcriptional regulator
MQLLRHVEDILDRGGFDYCEYNYGCFDIAARRKFTLFLKVLDNVDSFQETQANNLKIIAGDVGATIALVGTHTRRETLEDSVLYERFDVPTMSPDTLESIVANDAAPIIYRARGGLFAEIDANKLRKNREKAGLSMSQLAESVGVSKKNIYEHEHESKKAVLDVVEKIEKLIGEITSTAAIDKSYSFEKNQPHDRFETIVSKDLKRIGFSSDLVHQAPFNIVAKEKKIMVLSKADAKARRIEKDAPFMAQLSSVTRVPAVAIANEEMNLDIPSIPEKKLREMQKARDIRKFIK